MKKIFSVIIIAFFIIGFSFVNHLGFATSTNPVYVSGNPTCEELGYQYEFKIDPPNDGTYNLPNNIGSITLTNTGQGQFNWSSTFGIDAVIAKGGPVANVYYYNPEATGDNGLSTPINPNNNKPYGLSHASFCYDVDPLNVSKTAKTDYTRTYSWDIEKTANTSSLGIINSGEIKTVNYSVGIKLTSYTDNDFKVSGTVTITNPVLNPKAIITNIQDQLDVYGSVTLNCGDIVFPYMLSGGQSLVCTYEVQSDGTDSLNTVTVTTTGIISGGTATAPVNWTEPTNLVDECITVNDTNLEGPQNELVCVNNLENDEYKFDYNVTFSKDQNADVIWQCDQTEYTNTASMLTNDRKLTKDSSWKVTGEIMCTIPQPPQWCSPGYWRQPHHLDSWDATGISPNSYYSSYFGVNPPRTPKGIKDKAPINPTLLQVLQNPQWYGGDAFNKVGDLLSEAHPDVNFTGERVENSCPLN